MRQPMPAEWCSGLELPDGATFAIGAEVFLKSLADQTSLPWTGDFPRKAARSQFRLVESDRRGALRRRCFGILPLALPPSL